MDGDNAQIPMIMGAFGRTSQVPQQEASEAFKPFTGYTSKSGIGTIMHLFLNLMEHLIPMNRMNKIKKVKSLQEVSVITSRQINSE